MAALCARITKKSEPAVATRAPHCPAVGIAGRPNAGRPLGTVPRVDTPMAARPSHALATIDPTTAMSGNGIFLLSIPPPTMTMSTAADTATVGMLAEGIARIALNACASGPFPVFSTPSMPAI